MERTFFVAGGDARQRAIVQMLEKRGAAVHSFGFACGDRLTPETVGRLGAAEVVLLPLPAVDGGGFLHAPAMEKKLPAEMLWPLLRPRQKIFGGMLTETVLRSAAEYHLSLVDYYRREEFVLRNAYITAESALQLTMERLGQTVRGTDCLVLGYGRIGRFLSRMLGALGAKVRVADRRGEELVRAELEGCEACALERLPDILAECRVVYNTIPHLTLDRGLLQMLPGRCLCIDLASKPGGIDFGAAEELGVETVWALGLPGKAAPEAAGGAILDTVLQILSEQEVSN